MLRVQAVIFLTLIFFLAVKLTVIFEKRIHSNKIGNLKLRHIKVKFNVNIDPLGFSQNI